jgi:hypothetical protein
MAVVFVLAEAAKASYGQVDERLTTESILPVKAHRQTSANKVKSGNSAFNLGMTLSNGLNAESRAFGSPLSFMTGKRSNDRSPILYRGRTKVNSVS